MTIPLIIVPSSQETFRVGIIRYPYWDTSVINSDNLQYQLPHLDNILIGLKHSPEFEVLDPVDLTISLLTSVSNSKGQDLRLFLYVCMKIICEFLQQ